MSARILQFPQGPLLSHMKVASCGAVAGGARRFVSKELAGGGHFSRPSSQNKANRIVAQMEHEIVSQTNARAQGHYAETPKRVADFVTTASVARRILRALSSFAHSA
jgi:hypothetical protein